MTRPTEHTPGPWHSPGCDGLDRVLAYHDTDGKRRTIAHVYGITLDQRDANAARIVACVNACEGVPTAELETVARGEPQAVGILANAQELFKARAERDTLAAQNAELREVLHGITKHINEQHQFAANLPMHEASALWRAAVDHARAMLARLDGGK